MTQKTCALHLHLLAGLSILALAPPLAADSFFTVSPCRVLDTRTTGTPVLTNTPTAFTVGGKCYIPANSSSVSFNATLVGANVNVDLGMYPGDLATLPTTNVVSCVPSLHPVIASNAVISLSQDGQGTVKVLANSASAGQTDLILDVNGFFITPKRVEIATTGSLSRIISPTFYDTALSGTYYNAHPLRINNTLYMFVQGGQFCGPPDPRCPNAPSVPGVTFCNGDGVILFQAPFTQSGVLGQYSSVTRVSPCTSPVGSQPPYHHWAPSNVFVLGSNYVMLGAGDLGTGSGGQIMLWTATYNSGTNQFAGSWQPFMAASGGPSSIVVQPDPTRTWNDGFSHQSLRGYAWFPPQQTSEVQIDFSDEWCSTSLSKPSPWCAQIQFKQNGSWVSLSQGVLNFPPDPFLTDFKPRELTSQTIAANGAASPPYELWGSYNQYPSNGQGPCPEQTGGGFQYYEVNSDWTVSPPIVVSSHLRPMPSGLASMRAFTAPLYFGNHLYMFSSSNDDNICQTQSNPYAGMYLIWSELGPN
jgi:hypothetical protein